MNWYTFELIIVCPWDHDSKFGRIEVCYRDFDQNYNLKSQQKHDVTVISSNFPNIHCIWNSTSFECQLCLILLVTDTWRRKKEFRITDPYQCISVDRDVFKPRPVWTFWERGENWSCLAGNLHCYIFWAKFSATSWEKLTHFFRVLCCLSYRMYPRGR